MPGPLDCRATGELLANPSYAAVSGIGDGAVSAAGGSMFVRSGPWQVEVAVSLPGSPSAASTLAAEAKVARALLVALP